MIPASRQLSLPFGLLALVWLWAAIEPLSRSDWLLENLLVFFFGGLLLATRRRFAFFPGRLLAVRPVPRPAPLRLPLHLRRNAAGRLVARHLRAAPQLL
ncbi:hypothetical protein ACFS3C_23345 [Azotobacter vinelandii]